MFELFFIILFAVLFLFLIKSYKEDKIERLEMRKRLMEDVDATPYYSITDDEIEHYKAMFVNELILSVKVFQINDTFYDIKNKHEYMIDGGVEFHLPKGYLCFGFSSHFDQIVFNSEPFHKNYTHENEYELTPNEIPEIYNFLNKRITDVKFKIMEFDEILDYTMKTQKIKKPVELILKFENGEILQLSSINFDLGENSEPENYRYANDEEILITFKETKIKS
uniref:hypothetical protein n=2 Tax=Flavobacterium sp. TaxID=239 RepID=UPI00404A1433